MNYLRWELKKKIKNHLKANFRPLFSKLADHLHYIIAPRKYSGKNQNEIIHSETVFVRYTPFHLGELHKKFLKRAPGITFSSEITFVRVISQSSKSLKFILVLN